MRAKIGQFLLLALLLNGCSSKPYPGPDKQFAGSLSGAAVGAGAGAMTGLQVSAGTGPGAVVGAGIGAVAGGLQGFAHDQDEESMVALSAATGQQRKLALVHEILEDHYRRRMQLHPTRDIFPSDMFFFGDETKLRKDAAPLIGEIARLNKQRLPWSRLAIVAYARANDKKSTFARHLVEKRSRKIADQMVRAGIEPKRLEARGVIIDAPLLLDPADRPDRYNQAIEIIPLDR